MEKDSVVSKSKPTLVSVTISVKYRFHDGYHIFTSPDVKGLHIASKDARKAFEDISEVLEELIWRKTKQRATVKPTVPFDEWVKQRAAHRVKPPLSLSDRNFIVELRAA